MPVRRALGWIDRNPFASLYLPPLIVLGHFAILLRLASLRFPDHPRSSVLEVSLLLVGMFLLVFLCLGGMALGVRQAFLLSPCAFPILGILANLLYLVAFILYFLLIFVLQNLT